MKRCLIMLCIAGSAMAAGLGGAFEFNIDDLKDIDPTLLKYTETKAVELKLDGPSALALGKGGEVFIAGASEMQAWKADLSAVKTAKKLKAPATALAVDGDGNVYVGVEDHVEVIPAKGDVLSWADLGEDSRITSIAISGDSVFIADAGQRALWKFSKAGKLKQRIGGRNSVAGKKGFIVPSANFDVAAAGDGTLWIVNPGMHTLIHIDAAGKKLASWRKRAQTIDGFCGCCNPCHIAVMSDGAIVTGEKALMRVKVVAAEDGALKSVVAGPRLFEKNDKQARLGDGAKPGMAQAIADIVVSGDKILVLDRNASVLRVFEKKSQ